MRKAIIPAILLSFNLAANSQITVSDCQKAAQENYPVIARYDLIRQSGEYTLSNVKKGNLPQVNVSGRVSYQSEATTFPFEIPGTGAKGLPRDQYQIVMEVSQNIWDGGVIHNRKEQAEAMTAENERGVDVSMYALRERVNQVFFGILLLDEQLRQNDILNENLDRNLRDVENYISNGIASAADADAVKVEILRTRQNRARLLSSRKSFVNMLSLLTGKEMSGDETFVRPEPMVYGNESTINRPELLLYEARKQSLMINMDGLRSGYMPKLSLFAQGGYGNPGLDMLKNEFRPFYVIGARLTWNFGSLYTLKNDKRKIENNIRQIDTERELFLFNTRLRMREQEGSLKTLEQQMQDDEEIIRLRTNIRKAAEAKVANGTLSVTEMLHEVTQESLAMQTKALHEIELLMQQYQMKHITN